MCSERFSLSYSDVQYIVQQINRSMRQAYAMSCRAWDNVVENSMTKSRTEMGTKRKGFESFAGDVLATAVCRL